MNELTAYIAENRKELSGTNTERALGSYDIWATKCTFVKYCSLLVAKILGLIDREIIHCRGADRLVTIYSEYLKI